MTDFIPPYPTRPNHFSPLDILTRGRKDLLSIWSDDSFQTQFMKMQMINRQVFVANCPDVVRYVTREQADNYRYNNALVRKALEPLLGQALFTDTAVQLRSQAMREQWLYDSEQTDSMLIIIMKTVEEFAQIWRVYSSNTTIKILPEMQRLTATITARLLFGRSLSSVQIQQLFHAVGEYRTAMEQMDVNVFFGLPNWLSSLKTPKTPKLAKPIHEFIDKLIAKGIDDNNKGSLLAYLLNYAEQAEDKPSTVEIRHELIVSLLTCHEISANTLAWLWGLLSSCTELEQNLHAELAQTDGASIWVDSLPYTQALIKETLRLYPPFPVLLRETAKADVIRRRDVSAGAFMLVIPWLLHRHRLYWDKPDHFIPERFLNSEPIEPCAYVPFNLGSCSAITEFFSMNISRIALAVLARDFALRLAEGQQLTHECRLTLHPKTDLTMQLYARSAS